MSEYKFGRNSKKNMKGVDERIIELAKRVLAKSPYDFGVPQYGGFRTPQEQNNLFHRRPKVTNLDGFNKISYHQSGMALDIFLLIDGKATWEHPEKYKEVADLFKAEFELMKEEEIFNEHEYLEWGGDWRWKDLPHFQVVFSLKI